MSLFYLSWPAFTRPQESQWSNLDLEWSAAFRSPSSVSVDFARTWHTTARFELPRETLPAPFSLVAFQAGVRPRNISSSPSKRLLSYPCREPTTRYRHDLLSSASVTLLCSPHSRE